MEVLISISVRLYFDTILETAVFLNLCKSHSRRILGVETWCSFSINPFTLYLDSALLLELPTDTADVFYSYNLDDLMTINSSTTAAVVLKKTYES